MRCRSRVSASRTVVMRSGPLRKASTPPTLKVARRSSVGWGPGMPTPVLVLGTNLTLPRPALSMWPGRYLRMSDSTLSRSLVSNGSNSVGFTTVLARCIKNANGARSRDSLQHARSFCQEFFSWYNTEHHHSGLGLLTPEVVHSHRAEQVRDLRQHTLDIAYAAHPERFVRKPPQPPRCRPPSGSTRHPSLNPAHQIQRKQFNKICRLASQSS